MLVSSRKCELSWIAWKVLRRWGRKTVLIEKEQDSLRNFLCVSGLFWAFWSREDCVLQWLQGTVTCSKSRLQPRQILRHSDLPQLAQWQLSQSVREGAVWMTTQPFLPKWGLEAEGTRVTAMGFLQCWSWPISIWVLEGIWNICGTYMECIQRIYMEYAWNLYKEKYVEYLATGRL